MTEPSSDIVMDLSTTHGALVNTFDIFLLCRIRLRLSRWRVSFLSHLQFYRFLLLTRGLEKDRGLDLGGFFFGSSFIVTFFCQIVYQSSLIIISSIIIIDVIIIIIFIIIIIIIIIISRRADVMYL